MVLGRGWRDGAELNLADLDPRLRGWLFPSRRGRPAVSLGRMDWSRVAWSGQDVPGGMETPWERVQSLSFRSAHFY